MEGATAGEETVVGLAEVETAGEGEVEGWAAAVRAVEAKVEGWAAEATVVEGKGVEMEEGWVEAGMAEEGMEAG